MTDWRIAAVTSPACSSRGLHAPCGKYAPMHVWGSRVFSRIVVRRQMMAVMGQVSVPVASWCTLWFFLPLFWSRMLSVADVHLLCSVVAGKVCGSRVVPLHKAMS